MEKSSSVLDPCMFSGATTLWPAPIRSGERRLTPEAASFSCPNLKAAEGDTAAPATLALLMGTQPGCSFPPEIESGGPGLIPAAPVPARVPPSQGDLNGPSCGLSSAPYPLRVLPRRRRFHVYQSLTTKNRLTRALSLRCACGGAASRENQCCVATPRCHVVRQSW